VRILLVALGASLLAAEAHAISTYNPTQMACAEVKAVIRREGQVTLRWISPRAGVPRYGRYVSNSGYCRTGERAQQTLVPTRDRKSCGVNDCRPFVHDDFF
jgi:hypothetical protein